MAIDKVIYVPLFSENSVTVESPFFHIFPGEIAQIQGFGFAGHKDRYDAGLLQVPQVACLESLLFKETFHPVRDGANNSPIMDLGQYKAELLARETMRRNDCTFSISKCNNTMLLNIPGSYCFTMNDVTALGNAHLYLRIFTKDEFPWNSKFFIGEN